MLNLQAGAWVNINSGNEQESAVLAAGLVHGMVMWVRVIRTTITLHLHDLTRLFYWHILISSSRHCELIHVFIIIYCVSSRVWFWYFIVLILIACSVLCACVKQCTSGEGNVLSVTKRFVGCVCVLSEACALLYATLWIVIFESHYRCPAFTFFL